ncbi:indolepyruvate ferredoxin oxidoreductase alpha subunit [Anaerovirgula multivorans]|uniref:Indolepyruvate oxidoreductase subunit IorA n=2 Tax=Anaerovirgula multivorans TaxID=312168 RepID=A0A239J9Y8_9FIRM|nr:indolepyruvate ferredoxin oxidoreductase alpha subunit [Anaerovirgula multivorans]
MEEKKVVAGNEAAAIGAYESGISVATGYPGAPCSQVLEYIERYEDIYCEWSTNEKTAMETAIGASFNGKRSFVVMKTLGLNVAADALLQYSGTKINGGIVVLVADDVGRIVGDDYQDSRNYGIAAQIPVLEPADSEETRRFIKFGYEISEKYSIPVILRMNAITSKSKSVIKVDPDLTVTQSEHIRYNYCAQKMVTNVIRFGFSNYKEKDLVKYWHNFKQYWNKLKQDCNDFSVNTLTLASKKIGIIASGVSYYYAKEVMPNASYLKVGMAYPLPEKLIRQLANYVDELYIIEGFQPVLEKEIKALGIPVKGSEIFPRFPYALYFTSDIIAEKILGLLPDSAFPFKNVIPFRIPTNCPGCPHLFLFYLLHKNQIKSSGAIGCAGLGALPHIGQIDIVQCMGSSIGIAHGYNKAAKNNEKFVAITGDGEFWHTGVNNLINVVYNKGNVTTIIMDNFTVAMTGGQGNPSSGYGLGHEVNRLSIEKICEAIGVADIQIVDPYNLEEFEKCVTSTFKHDKPAVIIARRPCLVFSCRSEKKTCQITDRCKGCLKCAKIGCLAIELTEGNGQTFALINPHRCIGCGLCQQVCQIGAIEYA